jgi:hypothetical protein
MVKKVTAGLVDNYKAIVLCMVLFINCSTDLHSQNVTDRIKLNQLGFYPDGPKTAVVTGEIAAIDFYITSTNLRDTIFSGKLSTEQRLQFFRELEIKEVMSSVCRVSGILMFLKLIKM